MKVTDYIREAFGRTRDRILFSHYATPSWAWSPCEKHMPFGRVVWSNITEIMASIANDVTFTNLSPDKALTFASFKRLFDMNGEHIITRLFDEGAVAIGYDETLGFWLMKPNEYTKTTIGDDTTLTANRPEVRMYVMRSSTFESKGISDRTMCEPFIQFIDNALNASNTASARLGALIVGSPMQSSAMPTATVLTKEQKQELEKTLSQEYGSLSGQKQFLLLPRSMNFQTISLAAIDQRTSDKVRLAILAICDRIKVPANQVAIIDANSSKSLSNGSELREGDFNKYQAFERLLNRTFVRMAMEAGLSVDYTIYNKPERESNAIASMPSDMLGVLSTNEKREALGYEPLSGDADTTTMAQRLGVGGTQSLVEIAQSENISVEEKRGYLKVLFGMSDEQIDLILR